MKLKLFGKEIIEFRTNKHGIFLDSSREDLKKATHLPDFYKAGNRSESNSYVMIVDESGKAKKETKARGKKKAKGIDVRITPKGVYKLEMLNKKGFVINTNKAFIDEQIKSFEDKLSLIDVQKFDMAQGVKEISSVLVRLENRRKYSGFKKFFDQFAYTTSSMIDGVTKIHNHLQLGEVHQFMADMPKEAVEVMKNYSKNTEKLCNKKPLFYIIADKKDFQKTNSRKDPILLAQSPFGHFWQILGAWDEEVLFLEEL